MGPNNDFGQTFEALGEDRDDLDDEDVDDNSRAPGGRRFIDPDANMRISPDIGGAGDDSLDYSAGTGTLGASSLNFGFTTNKSFF